MSTQSKITKKSPTENSTGWRLYIRTNDALAGEEYEIGIENLPFDEAWEIAMEYIKESHDEFVNDIKNDKKSYPEFYSTPWDDIPEYPYRIKGRHYNHLPSNDEYAKFAKPKELPSPNEMVFLSCWNDFTDRGDEFLFQGDFNEWLDKHDEKKGEWYENHDINVDVIPEELEQKEPTWYYPKSKNTNSKKELDKIIKDALKNGNNMNKLNDLESEFFNIENSQQYMDKWLIKNFPRIPLKYLLEYTSLIFEQKSDNSILLNLTPKDIQDALYLYCISNSIFNSNIITIYTKGWEESTTKDSDFVDEIFEILKEKFQGQEIDVKEFKHTLLESEEGEEFNSRNRRK